jgi:hypothetical protein
MKIRPLFCMRVAALLFLGVTFTLAACNKKMVDEPITTKSSPGRMKKPAEGPKQPEPMPP